MKLSALFKVNLIGRIESRLWELAKESSQPGYEWVESYIYQWDPYEYEYGDTFDKNTLLVVNLIYIMKMEQ